MTGSLLEWANTVLGVKVIPVPGELKEMLEEWLNFNGPINSRPVPSYSGLSAPLKALRADWVSPLSLVTAPIPCPTLAIPSRIWPPAVIFASEDTLMLVSPAFAGDVSQA